MAVQNIPAITQISLFSYGFNTSYIDNTTFSVGAGVCRDSHNLTDIIVGTVPAIGPVVSAPIVVKFARNGLNGLDTGTIAASSLYVLYAIGDSSGFNPSGFILSLETSTALIPSGYDSYRVISYIKTDASSHIVPFFQFGIANDKTMFYNNGVSVLTGGNSTTPALVDLTGVVPARNTNISVSLSLTIVPGVAGDSLVVNNVFEAVGQVVAIPNFNSVSNVAVGYSGGVTPVLQYLVTAGTDSADIEINSFHFSI